MSVVDAGSTGCVETSVFHGLSEGNTRRAPSAGLEGVPGEDVSGGSVSDDAAPPHARSANDASDRVNRAMERIAVGVRVHENDGSRRAEDTSCTRRSMRHASPPIWPTDMPACMLPRFVHIAATSLALQT